MWFLGYIVQKSPEWQIILKKIVLGEKKDKYSYFRICRYNACLECIRPWTWYTIIQWKISIVLVAYLLLKLNGIKMYESELRTEKIS